MGVAETPGVPCALFSGGTRLMQSSGEIPPRERCRMSAVIASETKQSRIAYAALDSFVANAPRNDDISSARLSGHALAGELILGHDPVSASFLGLIERPVAAFDQIVHGFAELELADADRHGDAGQGFAGRAANDWALRDRAADAFGARGAGGEIRAGKNGDELFAAIAGRQINISHALAQGLPHQPKNLVADD